MTPTVERYTLPFKASRTRTVVILRYVVKTTSGSWPKPNVIDRERKSELRNYTSNLTVSCCEFFIAHIPLKCSRYPIMTLVLTKARNWMEAEAKMAFLCSCLSRWISKAEYQSFSCLKVRMLDKGRDIGRLPRIRMKDGVTESLLGYATHSTFAGFWRRSSAYWAIRWIAVATHEQFSALHFPDKCGTPPGLDGWKA